MDLIKRFLSLPALVEFEGIAFSLELFKNGEDDARLCYVILNVDQDSKHRQYYVDYGGWENPFTGGFKSFLCLIENIETEEDFAEAILQFEFFLKQHNLCK